MNKWKNHFYEMKGGVGMSGHVKGRKQEDAYTKTDHRRSNMQLVYCPLHESFRVHNRKATYASVHKKPYGIALASE